ncbi:MAG: lysylphosphatidylglycerol synthase transmembrane domain-containing protein [Bacteroidia bacterium]
MFLAIGLLLLYLAFKGKDINQMFRDIMNARFGWIILSILFGLAAFISRAIRWKMLLEPLGYKPKVSNTFNSMMVGYLANFAIPRLGEVTRCTVLAQKEKIPFNVLFGTVIVERAVDLIMLVLSLILASLLELNPIGNFIFREIVYPIIEKVQSFYNPIIIIIVIAGILIIVAIVYSILRRSEKFSGIIPTFYKQLTGLTEGIKSVFKMKNTALFFVHTFFIWTMYFFMSYVCFFSLDETSVLGFKAGVFILVIGGIGMAAPVQGGIGVYHLLVQQGLLMFGIDAQSGLTYATIVHTSQTLMILLMGATSLGVLFMTKPVSDEKA